MLWQVRGALIGLVSVAVPTRVLQVLRFIVASRSPIPGISRLHMVGLGAVGFSRFLDSGLPTVHTDEFTAVRCAIAVPSGLPFRWRRSATRCWTTRATLAGLLNGRGRRSMRSVVGLLQLLTDLY